MLDWLLGAPLEVGSVAPDFEASDENGTRVAMASLRGKNVILVFYPADDTPGCTKQLCDFRDSWGACAGRNAVVFGVNPAGSGKHAQFRDKHSLPFPLLIDEGQRIAKAYKSSMGIAPRRTVYLIGPDGRIRFAQRGMPSPGDVLAHAA
jgi:thioredoxin-dependent peroxiredoxin